MACYMDRGRTIGGAAGQKRWQVNRRRGKITGAVAGQYDRPQATCTQACTTACAPPSSRALALGAAVQGDLAAGALRQPPVRLWGGTRCAHPHFRALQQFPGVRQRIAPLTRHHVQQVGARHSAPDGDHLLQHEFALLHNLGTDDVAEHVQRARPRAPHEPPQGRLDRLPLLRMALEASPGAAGQAQEHHGDPGANEVKRMRRVDRAPHIVVRQ
eukprot:CAMPEP_0174332204 /NCGR_PEP_ID=MMETSP0810-20121108/18124_1 /TAXON_ID=73025 ORGANISM="Eutreptiella gymnastica-like, Strain CCMP1594" /NCGR_SAMPLE_ID=MMETSP0810 /ASSEMBLY_ACC=CAM_ASM_000659 /LENGTH=213 /DNA_ID=CAMNT_0015448499 /DNA_START=109 /DNA_END=748 /DNA_ORIENTATION=+